MEQAELDQYLQNLGFKVDIVNDQAGAPYTAIRSVEITLGAFARKTCDVALARVGASPYAVASAVHVSPHLVVMGSQASQASALGPGWQYLSRRFDHAPTPQRIWTWVLTVLCELR